MTRWRERPEGGEFWLIALYARGALAVGRRLSSLLLPPIALYFLLARSVERRESRRFLEKTTGRRIGLGDIYRHFRTFAQVVLDRVFLLALQDPPLTIDATGMEELERVLDAGRGCLLLGSHLGSFEASRILSLRRPEVPVRILMDRDVNANVTTLLETLNPQLANQVIDVSAGPAATMLTIQQAFREGGLVAILGDRTVPGDKTARVDFLGGSVEVPTAPYLIAAVTRVPIVLFFGFYRGRGRYSVVFEPFADGLSAPRRDREAALATLAQRFADRLGEHARANPYNWFNFYGFWGDSGQ